MIYIIILKRVRKVLSFYFLWLFLFYFLPQDKALYIKGSTNYVYYSLFFLWLFLFYFLPQDKVLYIKALTQLYIQLWLLWLFFICYMYIRTHARIQRSIEGIKITISTTKRMNNMALKGSTCGYFYFITFVHLQGYLIVLKGLACGCFFIAIFNHKKDVGKITQMFL